ncbi:MAG: ABC transporter permease [Nitrospira sp.]|nr:ABC transporter permease [Nitrospira sp.]MDH4251782.1 ABC transporter permease [Nitrospira sp.]MDH4344011.1 ABC transporter permease [Nitrospira sp.]MDH5337366.1 ABC transporter permease [Nitrospira sp.]
MRILSIAVNTFRENLREKLLYNLLFFALLMIGSSILLSRITLGDYHRLILDLGLASINLFGVLIAIFVGIGLVSKEVDRKTIYTIVSKPIPRYEFLLGKYCGLVITLFANTIVMVVGLLIVLQVMDVPITSLVFKSLALIFLELMVITAVAVLFSTFTSATLSAIFTLAVYMIGHLSGDLKEFSKKLDEVSQMVVNAIYYTLPNLERFNLKGHVIHHLDFGMADMALTLAYGLTYAAFLLLLASIVFQRRDFQ